MKTIEFKERRKTATGHFDNIIYTPDYLFIERLNNLIDNGVVKYYPSLTAFKNRKILMKIILLFVLII